MGVAPIVFADRERALVERRTLDDVWLFGDFAGICEADRLRFRRRNRVLTILVLGGGYALDTLFLYLFWLGGTIPGAAVAFFGLGGLSHVLLFLVLNWLKIADRAQEPNLTEWQMAFALTVQVVAIGLAPRLATFFFGIMFVVFAFGVQRVPLHRILIFWGVAGLAATAVLVSSSDAVMTFDFHSASQTVLLGVAFSSLLLRTLLLDYYSTALRKRLLSHSVRLTASVEVAESEAKADALTGLLNRRAIDPLMSELIARLRSHASPACVAMMDIDYFKAINDRHGHLIGDQVLRQLAQIMAKSIRASDSLVRYGGEEFVLLLAATNLSQGRALVERLRSDVEKAPWGTVASGLNVTISAGISVVSDDDIKSILARADSALYQAKRSGRNCVVAYLDDVSTLNAEVQ